MQEEDPRRKEEPGSHILYKSQRSARYIKELRKRAGSLASFSTGMKETKLRDKKVLLVPFPSMSPSSLLLFVLLQNRSLKLQLRCSWSSYKGFRGCCYEPALRWPTTAVSARSGARTLRIYIAGDREEMFCRNSSMPSITSSITDTLSSKPSLSFLPRSLALLIFSFRIEDN